MRHVFPTMGTMASLAIEAADAADAELIDTIERIFGEADARFSLYRDDSELSRINSGRATLLDASPALQEAYALSTEWRSATGGAFTPMRPDGLLDLNGVVKAVAMRDAGRVLDEADLDGWTLVVGGDMLASGVDAGGRPWITGIIDPAERTSVLCAIELRQPRRAIATSGNAERGDHIWKAGLASSFVQATVVADDIVTADVLATAIVAGGEQLLDEACARWSIDVLTVDEAGELRATPGFRSALTAG